MFSNIRNNLKKNKFCIKLYSILQWHERFYALKRFLYMDREMEKNDFILTMKNGIKFYIPYYKTDLIQKDIANTKNFYEVEILNTIFKQSRFYTPQKGIFLDIGSNIGNHTLYCFSKDLIQFAYCFEPVQDTFQILQKNISINSLQNKVKLFNVGVGETQGTAQIKSYNINNTGSSQLKISNEGNIPIISIDDIKFEQNISFVKIDVEGFELNVIKGILNTIKTHKPTIFIEIRNQFFNEINKYLKDFGYNHQRIDNETDNEISNYLFFTTGNIQK